MFECNECRRVSRRRFLSSSAKGIVLYADSVDLYGDDVTDRQKYFAQSSHVWAVDPASHVAVGYVLTTKAAVATFEKGLAAYIGSADPMTAVWPVSSIMVVTIVDARVRGSAIEPDSPAEPTVNTSKPGGARFEVPVPERLVSFGMISITIRFVPGTMLGRTRSWKPISTGEPAASLTTSCRPPAGPLTGRRACWRRLCRACSPLAMCAPAA